MDKIQMTEEQAIKLVDKCFYLGEDWDESFNNTIASMKSEGYIKQTELEKAKEDYCKAMNYISSCMDMHENNSRAIENFIEELEKEIERLNK